MRLATATVILLLTASAGSAASGRYVVALKRGARAGHAHAMQERRVVSFDHLDAYAADLTEAEVVQLQRSGEVRYVEPVAVRHILGITPAAAADSLRNLDGQTIPPGLDIVHARDAWSVTRGEKVNVVVIDTGIDYRHPDLVDAYAGGFNALTLSSDPMDDHNHGTHVAGTIAAADNGIGVVGVAPKVRLWGVKALKSDGTGTTDLLIAAINWVIGQKRSLGGNWIINFSIGSQLRNIAEGEAVARAIAEGILVVAASGNDSTGTNAMPVAYPAAYPGVLSIGAVDNQLRHAEFSNQGPNLGAVAPGVDVLSSVRGGGGVLSGVFGQADAYSGAPLEGSASGTITATAVYCGLGRAGDFPATVAGNIAIIRRGGDTFAEKTRRAKAAGAAAVLIVDYAESTVNQFTLINAGDPDAHTFAWPVTIALRNIDGERLIATWNPTVTVMNRPDDYMVKSGTSMSAPHGAGVAALAWSVAPNARAEDVANALKMKADDLGAGGVDNVFGHGVLDAVEAGAMLNPAAFGRVPSGRRTLRRGGR